MAKKSLSKKQLKEDKFVSLVNEVIDYTQVHPNYILGAILGIVIIVGGIFLFFHISKLNDMNASALLSEANRLYQDKKYSEAEQKYIEVTKKYWMTSSASEADFFLANSYYKEGKYDLALQRFEKYYNKHSNDPLFGASALSGMADCYIQQKNYEKAVSIYNKTAEKYKQKDIRISALTSEGRCYEMLNNYQKAKEAYQKVFTEYSKEPLAVGIKADIARVEGKMKNSK
jgi:TolA-binding protein